MKKCIGIFLCLAVTLALTGCGSGDAAPAKTGNKPAGVNDVLEQGMAEADSKNTDNASQPAESISDDRKSTDNEEPMAQEPSAEPEPVPEPSAGPDPAPDAGPAAEDAYDSIDVDLTALSSTMVYSEVYNMMVYPDEYIGKSVKIKGLFASCYDEADDNYYFACIIQDATACCAQGIEFVLTDDYSYPNDYPQEDAEICVVGVFDTYQDGDYIYCTLRNARLL